MTAVIFDLDGVLVDSEPLWSAGFAEVVNEYAAGQGWVSPGLVPGQLGAYQGGRVNETLREIPDGNVGIRQLPSSPTPQVVDELTEHAGDPAGGYCIPGARPTGIASSVETARELHARGLKLGVASSSAIDFIDTVLDTLGLSDAFSARQSSLLLKRGKPDGEVYRRTLQELDERAEDCLAIEDSARGIGAAEAAGIRCIGLWREPGSRPDAFKACVWVTPRLSRRRGQSPGWLAR